MNDEYLYSAEKRLVLMYIGARLKRMNVERKILATNLINSAIKGRAPVFFSAEGECFTGQELIDIACNFIYYSMEKFLYNNGNLKREALEGCISPNHVKSLLYHVIKKVLDFKYFKDVEINDVVGALLSNEEDLKISSAGYSMCTGDSGDGLKCQRLIERAVCDYAS